MGPIPGGAAAFRDGLNLDFGPTVADRYDPVDNGVTALRLLLALSVLVLHAWAVGGFGADPLVAATGGRLEATDAVYAFFGLSGFLLVESRRRQSRAEFMWRRARRILPAYWLAVALGALIVGPWYIGAAWLPFPGVGATWWVDWLDHPSALVNASLWTLPFELVCYLILAVIPGRFLRTGLLVVLAAVVVMAGLGHWTEELTKLSVPLTAAFAIGGLIGLEKDRVPLSGAIAAALLVPMYVAAGTVAGLLLVPGVLAYVAVWAATRLRVRVTNDFSYGTYVFAFPLSQVLVDMGIAGLGVWALITASMAVTLPLAALSWFFVEKRALRVPAVSRGSFARVERLVRRPIQTSPG
jgi:peptidoglycan/LPS O-acetylase OafA/YrhL